MSKFPAGMQQKHPHIPSSPRTGAPPRRWTGRTRTRVRLRGGKVPLPRSNPAPRPPDALVLISRFLRDCTPCQGAARALEEELVRSPALAGSHNLGLGPHPLGFPVLLHRPSIASSRPPSTGTGARAPPTCGTLIADSDFCRLGALSTSWRRRRPCPWPRREGSRARPTPPPCGPPWTRGRDTAASSAAPPSPASTLSYPPPHMAPLRSLTRRATWSWLGARRPARCSAGTWCWPSMAARRPDLARLSGGCFRGRACACGGPAKTGGLPVLCTAASVRSSAPLMRRPWTRTGGPRRCETRWRSPVAWRPQCLPPSASLPPPPFCGGP